MNEKLISDIRKLQERHIDLMDYMCLELCNDGAKCYHRIEEKMANSTFDAMVSKLNEQDKKEQ